MDANAKELERLLAIAKIVQDAIKELGEVPSGHLYANLSGHMNLKTYQSIIALLKEAKVIREENHLLIWVGSRPKVLYQAGIYSASGEPMRTLEAATHAAFAATGGRVRVAEPEDEDAGVWLVEITNKDDIDTLNRAGHLTYVLNDAMVTIEWP
jgi:hypothetical protein